MALSEINSKNNKILHDWVKNHVTTSVKPDVDPAITDQSYNPNNTVKSIKQRQKTLAESEVQTIIDKYQKGGSTYELAKEFNCHHSTISRALKRNGIEVSHKAISRPELVKNVISLYTENKTLKEVASIVGVNPSVVRRVLQENNIRIRKSWEYPRR